LVVLARLFAILNRPPLPTSQMFYEFFNQRSDGYRVLVTRAKVPSALVLTRLPVQQFRQTEIAPQWLKYMLPWTNRPRISYQEVFPLQERPHRIRYQAVFAPITTAYYVPGAHRGQSHSRSRFREKGMAIRSHC